MINKLAVAAVTGLTTVSLAAGGHAVATNHGHPKRPQGGDLEIALDRSRSRSGLDSMLQELEARGVKGVRIEQDGASGFELELDVHGTREIKRELRQLKDLGIHPHLERGSQ